MLEGREPTTLGSLELPINETLQRSLRSRTKSRKVRTNYTLADMLIALVRAFYILITVSELSTITIPTSYKESQTLPEAAQQRAAVYVEIRMYNRNQTQRHSRRRDVQRVLRRRQVFIYKRGPNRKFSRFKARQYIRGFSQREGLDYDETYAVVAKLVSLRVLFAMIVEEDLECYQYNLIAAFLNVLIGDYIIYIEQLYGFEEGDSKTVYLLQKVLYRLKQVLLLQYNKFTKFAKAYRFDPFLSDAYVFRNSTTRVIIVIYIDDVLLIAKLLTLIFDTADTIRGTFPIRKLGKLHYYLGIRIIRNRAKRQLIVVQDAYIDKIATKFSITRLQPAATGALLGKT